MRLSAHKDSPFYDAAALLRKPQVFVDGIRVMDCVEVSEEEGWAVFYIRENGAFVLAGDELDAIAVAHVHGKVEIRFP